MFKLTYPICGSNLRYKRIDDGEMILEIFQDETIEELSNQSDGSTEIYCSKDKTHKISRKLQETIMNIASEKGY